MFVVVFWVFVFVLCLTMLFHSICGVSPCFFVTVCCVFVWVFVIVLVVFVCVAVSVFFVVWIVFRVCVLFV